MRSFVALVAAQAEEIMMLRLGRGRAESELEVSDLAVGEVSADLGLLEPVQVVQYPGGTSDPLRIVASSPSKLLPAISVTR